MNGEKPKSRILLPLICFSVVLRSVYSSLHYGLSPIKKGKLKFLHSKPCYTFNCDLKTFNKDCINSSPLFELFQPEICSLLYNVNVPSKELSWLKKLEQHSKYIF